MVIIILKSNGFHPYTRDKYIIKEGIYIKCIIRDIFFMLDK